MKRLAGSRSHEGVLHAVLSLACLNLAPGPPRGASDHFVSASIAVISDPLAIIQRMMRWRASRRGLKCKDFRRAKPGGGGGHACIISILYTSSVCTGLEAWRAPSIHFLSAHVVPDILTYFSPNHWLGLEYLFFSPSPPTYSTRTRSRTHMYSLMWGWTNWSQGHDSCFIYIQFV